MFKFNTFQEVIELETIDELENLKDMPDQQAAMVGNNLYIYNKDDKCWYEFNEHLFNDNDNDNYAYSEVKINKSSNETKHTCSICDKELSDDYIPYIVYNKKNICLDCLDGLLIL